METVLRKTPTLTLRQEEEWLKTTLWRLEAHKQPNVPIAWSAIKLSIPTDDIANKIFEFYSEKSVHDFSAFTLSEIKRIITEYRQVSL